MQNNRTKAIIVAAVLCVTFTAAHAQDRPSFNDMLRYAQATSRTSFRGLVAHATPYVNELAPKFRSHLTLLNDSNEQVRLALIQVEGMVERAEATPQDPKLQAAATQSFEKPLRLLRAVGAHKELGVSVQAYREGLAQDKEWIPLERASLGYWIRFHSGQTGKDIFGRPERDPANPADEMPHPMEPKQIPRLRSLLAQLDPVGPLNERAIAAAVLFQDCVDAVFRQQDALEQSLIEARDAVPKYPAVQQRMMDAARARIALAETVTRCQSPVVWGG